MEKTADMTYFEATNILTESDYCNVEKKYQASVRTYLYYGWYCYSPKV